MLQSKDKQEDLWPRWTLHPGFSRLRHTIVVRELCDAWWTWPMTHDLSTPTQQRTENSTAIIVTFIIFIFLTGQIDGTLISSSRTAQILHMKATLPCIVFESDMITKLEVMRFVPKLCETRPYDMTSISTRQPKNDLYRYDFELNTNISINFKFSVASAFKFQVGKLRNERTDGHSNAWRSVHIGCVAMPRRTAQQRNASGVNEL